MMADNNNSTQTDDNIVDSSTEDQMLADILNKSEILQEAGVVPREESQHEPELEYSEDTGTEEDLEEPVESAEYEDDVEPDNEEEEDSEKEDGDAEATEVSTYALDDLEDIMVTHKIDGEEVTLPISEWIAGSATKQHLSKQGREIGEARKSLDEERTQKLGELETLASVIANEVYTEETEHQKKYHDISQKLTAAQKEGDTYEIGELLQEQTKAQSAYWEARSKRENLATQVSQQKQSLQQQQFEESVRHFNDTITDVIPDWNSDIQSSIREFALQEGLPEALLDVVSDPNVVKFVDEFRRLKQGIKSGAKKRAKIPAKKMPAKKAKTPTKQKQDQAAMTKARAFKNDASKEDQIAFLKRFAPTR
jgi:Zn-dependent peptidase ImmA (M78 family)